MADPDDELAEAIMELAETIRELRQELEPDRRRPPIRPPTPREVLRVADEVAIPALLAMLEANVRALEAFQRGLRLLRRERDVRERSDATRRRTRERATDLRETTLAQLDAALSELQRAVSADEFERDDGTRDLLDDARRLRDEVDRRLGDAFEGTDSGTTGSPRTIEIDDETDADDGDEIGVTDDDQPNVDVDAELETLRDRYAPGDDEDTAENEEADPTDGDRSPEEGDDGDPGDDGGAAAPRDDGVRPDEDRDDQDRTSRDRDDEDRNDKKSDEGDRDGQDS